MKISDFANMETKGGYLPKINDFLYNITVLSDEVEINNGELNGKPTVNYEWKIRLESFDKKKLNALKMFPAMENKVKLIEDGIGKEFNLSLPLTASKQLYELTLEFPFDKNVFTYLRKKEGNTYIYEFSAIKP